MDGLLLIYPGRGTGRSEDVIEGVETVSEREKSEFIMWALISNLANSYFKPSTFFRTLDTESSWTTPL